MIKNILNGLIAGFFTLVFLIFVFGIIGMIFL